VTETGTHVDALRCHEAPFALLDGKERRTNPANNEGLSTQMCPQSAYCASRYLVMNSPIVAANSVLCGQRQEPASMERASFASLLAGVPAAVGIPLMVRALLWHPLARTPQPP
jgi:hypothetical protein